MLRTHDDLSALIWQEVLSIVLVALIAHLALIALVTTALTPTRSCTSNKRTVQNDLMTLTMAVEMYEVQHGELPRDLETLVGQRLIKKLSTDPWGRSYAFTTAQDSDHFMLRSAGPDRLFGSEDDIVAPDSTR